MESIKEQTFKGVAWNTISRFSNLGIQFVVGIILARLLTPEDYGVIGMLAIFIAIGSTFVDSGFTSALIQKQDLKDIDNSTAFYFNIVVAFLFYGILFVCAPWIAAFFDMQILTDVTRVAALNIVINSFTAVQQALYKKKIDFKTIAIVGIVATLLSGTVGIWMAYNNYGVWALVFQQLVTAVVTSVFLWIFSKWKPMWAFSWKSFKEMFSYGSKILGASLLSIVYVHGEKLAIGKFYSTEQLGLYTKGTQMSLLCSSNVTTILSTVTFPIFSIIQDDDERLINIYRRYVKFTSLVIFFLMLLLVALAKPIILFLYTTKWAGAVIFLQVIAFSMMFDHISALNLNVFYVKGRSDIVLKLEFIKRVMSIGILIVAIPFGVLAICLSKVIYEQIAMVINTYYTGKMFSYGFFQQWKDFGVYFLLSLIAVIPAFLLTFMSLPYIVILIIGALVSTGLYVGILKLKKDEIFNEYVVSEIKKRLYRFFKKLSN